MTATLRRSTRLERVPWAMVATLTATNVAQSAMHGSLGVAVSWAVLTVLAAARVFVAPASEVES